MNDEERRLFRREMGRAKAILEQCYLELRIRRLASEAYPLNRVREWVLENYDSDVEVLYAAYKATKDSEE